jgi:hypothetical protein
MLIIESCPDVCNISVSLSNFYIISLTVNKMNLAFTNL